MTLSMNKEIRISGIAASPGIFVGKVYLLDRARLIGHQHILSAEEISDELLRFKNALKRSVRQMKGLLGRLAEKGAGSEHTYILEAHLLLLKDPELIGGVESRIKSKLMNAEWALREFIDELKKSFSKIDNEYLQERGNDIDQIGQRILRNLLGLREVTLGKLPLGGIVVSHDLSPADTVHMVHGSLKGFVTELGGRTSHIAILARSMHVPAVVGADGVVSAVKAGDKIIVDGEQGLCIVNPTELTLNEYATKRKYLIKYNKLLLENRDIPAITTDGIKVSLLANVEKINELNSLDEYGAEGIGLYRTEYLFLDRKHLPDEEEQFEAYRIFLEKSKNAPVVIRTLDLGADKGLLGEQHIVEKEKQLSPALGLRGIRYCLKHPEIFTPQIRAILRASVFGNAKIMIPMVAGLEEVVLVKELLKKSYFELLSEGYSLPKQIPPLGVMIETPSAALISDILSKEVAFFSIGTNDLIHYTIAVDRMDERLAYLYQPLHPAVLRLLNNIAISAKNAKIDVSVCGEMAGEPLYSVILLGMGITSFSMSPISIPAVKDMVRKISFEKANKIVKKALSFKYISEVRDFIAEVEQEIKLLL